MYPCTPESKCTYHIVVRVGFLVCVGESEKYEVLKTNKRLPTRLFATDWFPSKTNTMIPRQPTVSLLIIHSLLVLGCWCRFGLCFAHTLDLLQRRVLFWKRWTSGSVWVSISSLSVWLQSNCSLYYGSPCFSKHYYFCVKYLSRRKSIYMYVNDSFEYTWKDVQSYKSITCVHGCTCIHMFPTQSNIDLIFIQILITFGEP